jgi:hypothetical protein
MSNLKPIAGVLALVSAFAPASSFAADDLAALRAELDALKSEYSSRVTALEGRIQQLESSAATAEAAAVAQVPPPVAAPAAAGRSSASALNPAMSMIIAGNYASLSQDPETYTIAGFMPSGGEIGPGERSFNLGESELTVSASIDPYFFGQVTAALSSEGEIGVEEAFVRTLALPAGLVAKGGRLFSGLGYLNELHAHAWDFIDAPLVYQAMFGSKYVQDGAQLKWIAPLDTFLEIGVEAGNGGGFPGTRRNRNSLSGNVVFAHVGGDLGDSTSWRAGASWLDARADGRGYEDVDSDGIDVENAFTGKSRTWVVDATLKWSPHGDTTRKQVKLQGEYMHREEEGELLFDASGAGLLGDYRSTQSGWYLQSVYQFRPRWRVGARFDSLDSGTPRIGLVSSGLLGAESFPALMSATPSRTSVMLDFSPSEFSRLRAQYAWDESRADERDRQLFLQYIYSIGAHGAHKF